MPSTQFLTLQQQLSTAISLYCSKHTSYFHMIFIMFYACPTLIPLIFTLLPLEVISQHFHVVILQNLFKLVFKCVRQYDHYSVCRLHNVRRD